MPQSTTASLTLTDVKQAFDDLLKEIGRVTGKETGERTLPGFNLTNDIVTDLRRAKDQIGKANLDTAMDTISSIRNHFGAKQISWLRNKLLSELDARHTAKVRATSGYPTDLLDRSRNALTEFEDFIKATGFIDPREATEAYNKACDLMKIVEAEFANRQAQAEKQKRERRQKEADEARQREARNRLQTVKQAQTVADELDEAINDLLSPDRPPYSAA